MDARESLVLEESQRIIAEKKVQEMKELFSKEVMYEQAKKRDSEEELASSKRREEELRNFVQQMIQMMSAGENILSEEKPSQAEREKDVENISQGKQTRDVQEPQGSKNCSSIDRLVEKLSKQNKEPPISPEDCSRFVGQVRAKKGKLSGFPMEDIVEEVRRVALEEAKEKARECPVCFDPMSRKLHPCKQCNQDYHSRSIKQLSQLYFYAATT